MARHRRRKCYNCGELYEPDPRNRYHQKYCEKAACRMASKKASQGKWQLGKGKGYFRGASNCERVQVWRKQHPGYWRSSKKRRAERALQDLSLVQNLCMTEVKPSLTGDALQEVLIRQAFVLTGLIAQLSGEALQDHIASVVCRSREVGQRLHQQAFDLQPLLGGLARELQTPLVSGATATDPPAVQLD